MKSEDKSKVGRREFMRTLGLGAGSLAAAGSLATGAKADSETTDEKRKSRYQETDHVKAFYRVNKYPS